MKNPNFAYTVPPSRLMLVLTTAFVVPPKYDTVEAMPNEWNQVQNRVEFVGTEVEHEFTLA